MTGTALRLHICMTCDHCVKGGGTARCGKHPDLIEVGVAIGAPPEACPSRAQILAYMKSSPQPDAARSDSEWPLIVRLLALRKREGEAGLGDTVHRLAEALGGVWMTRMLHRIGVECGCQARREALNARYPYA